MSSLFNKIKSVKQWEKDLVLGYHNEAQQLVAPKQIPLAISYLCLIYHHEYDYFDKVWEEFDMKINEKRDEFEYYSTASPNATVYGQMDIKISYIYSWKFLITAVDDDYASGEYLSIGITDSTEHVSDDFSIIDAGQSVPHSFYAYLSHGEKTATDTNDELYGSTSDVGDIVEMTVNTNKKQISFSVNGDDDGVAYNNIDFQLRKYKMAVYVLDKNVKIKLIGFEKEICRK